MMMRHTAAVLLIAVASKLHAQSLPPDLQRLVDLKHQAAASLSQVPDYACLETVERHNQGVAGDISRDVLRVEVVLAGGKESYAWPGNRKTSTDDLPSLIGYGLIVTGLFGMFANDVFTSRGAAIHFKGDETVEGSHAFRYDYGIPVSASSWRVARGRSYGDVGQRGSFWVDAKTLRLLMLEVNADPIPGNLPFTAIRIKIDYSAGAISERRALVPSAAEVWTTSITGEKNHDRIFFSQCRKFTVESALSLTSSGSGGYSPKPASPKEFQLPENLEVPIQLSEEIHSARAIVGDPVRATIAKDVYWKRKKLIAAGTALNGHIRRFEHLSAFDKYLVAIEFDQVQTSFGAADFFASLVRFDSLPEVKFIAQKSSETRKDLADGTSVTTIHSENVIPNEVPGVSTFVISGPAAVLPVGMRMVWKTINLSSKAHGPGRPVSLPDKIINPLTGDLSQ